MIVIEGLSMIICHLGTDSCLSRRIFATLDGGELTFFMIPFTMISHPSYDAHNGKC